MWSLLCGPSWAFGPVSLSAGVGAVVVPTYLGIHEDTVLLTSGETVYVGRGEGPFSTSRLEARLPLGARWSLGLGLASWSHRAALPIASVAPKPSYSVTPIGEARTTLVYLGPRIALQVRGPWLLPWLGCYASVAVGRPAWGRLTLEGAGLDGRASVPGARWTTTGSRRSLGAARSPGRPVLVLS